MAKSRKELVLDTIPEDIEVSQDGSDLFQSVSDSVDSAEEMVLKEKRRVRNKYKEKFAQPEQDMAPDVPMVKEIPQSDVVAVRDFGKTEADRLLRSLGIQTSVQLTRNDTYNLLAALMGCTEGQIDLLLSNPQLPLAIKIILRRLKDDNRVGNTELVEKLWDRLFGKGPLKDDLPNTGLVESGFFPSAPMSREAYAIIVKTLK